jgi:hypothetical protein
MFNIESDTLSCPSCFNEIAYEYETKKYSLTVTKNAVNCFEDYFEIYNGEQLSNIVKENTTGFNGTKEQFNEIGISIDNNTEKQFINLKCCNCYNPVGVRDSFNKYYIFFNAI